MSPSEREARAFELVGYMLTSARNLLDETPAYGPFRLIDAASRVIGVLADANEASPRLSVLRERIDEGKYVVMSDSAAFRTFLDELVLLLVESMEVEPHA